MPLFVLRAKAFQERQINLISLPTRRTLARDDIAETGDMKQTRKHTTFPGVSKIRETVRGKNQVHIEWTGLNLHEILASYDLLFEGGINLESYFSEGGDDATAIF